MAEVLDKYLNQLNDTLASTSSNRGNEAADICSNLTSLCIDNITHTEIAYCSSLLFNEETGIITFLKNVILLDEFAKCKEILLSFLDKYINKVKKKIAPYAVDIKDVCLSLFLRDKNSRVKNETFQVLFQLLELDRSIVEKFDIENMVEKYFSACHKPTKYTSTVKFGIYSLLGTLAELFPEFLVTRADRLVNIYVSVLKGEMNKKSKPDMPVIAGCIRGLGSTLVHFTQAVDEGSPYAADIYKFVRKSIDPKVDYYRYEIPRAGLSFVAKHSAQYKEFLTQDYEAVYEALVSWCKHNNKETRSNAFAALESFLKQVAECLVTKDETTGEIHPENSSIFKYFIKTFQRIINSNESITRDISIAIRGYGYFAKPCKLFMKDDDIKFMLNEMIQKSEQMYFNYSSLFYSDSELKEEKLQNLPSFLEALGFIVEEMDEVPYVFLSSLQRLVVVLIEKYPELGKGPQFLCCKAMLKLFLALARKGSSLKPFLSHIVYQGVIRTCSHPVALEEGGDEDLEYGVKRTTYKDYLELWECFLDEKFYKEQNMKWELSSLRNDVHRLVYNELVDAILKVAGKLDLSSFHDTGIEEGVDVTGETSTAQNISTTALNQSSSSISTEPVSDLQPKAPKDFQIFINLVEFSRNILQQKKTELFEEWIYTFGKQMVVLSSRFPFVSGFYKMLEIAMKLSRQLKYFKGITLADVSPNTVAMDVDQLDFSDSRNCFILFHKFVKEVVVRMKQYKDDLMASCLQLVLSLPNELVMCDMDVIIPALKMAFKLGLSFLPLAENALDALDTWTEELPGDVLHPYMHHVLPYLDGYLKTGTELGAVSDASGDVKETKSQRTAMKNYRRKKKVSPTEEESNPLNKVRHRILILLGKLGGRCNLGLLGGKEEHVVAKGIAWDTKQHLSFAVPFQDMKPTIYLDPFLPRVVELAISSSDRQTKVAASEVLHSLVLFMLGKSVQAPITGSETLLRKLWKHIFPVILQLACDVEQVCQQLFKPLLFQLMHWFTNNKQYESPDTITLLETLLDGIVHPTDTALRDLSAKCVEEFLQWSIKQTPEKQLIKSPINIKSLLKRLYSLASHPSANKRLGAALAFNNIYRVFREEESIVDIFVLEVLVVYLDSLAMSHHDDKCLGTQSQCVEVIGHLEKIIKVKSQKLNKQSKARRVPKSFPEDSVTLPHLVSWLVTNCGRPETECRHQCMRLVSVLTPHLPDCSSPHMWMGKTLKSNGKKHFILRFEGGFAGKSGIQQCPALSSNSGPFSLTATKHWFDLLLASLDCYSWVFGERYLKPIDIFQESQNEISSVLFQSLLFFVKQLSLEGIEAAVNCFKTTNVGVNAQHFSPTELQDYNSAKCTVVVRLMNFLTLLVKNDIEECLKIVPPDFWNSTLFDMVLSCTCEPQSLGFNIAELEVLKKLPEESGELCRLLAMKLPKEYGDILKECLLKKISLGGRCNLLDQLPLPLSGNQEGALDHSRLHFLVQGYQQLHNAKILLPALEKQGDWTAAGCSEKLLDTVFQGIVSRDDNDAVRVVNLTPTSQQFALKLLDLAFDLGLEIDKVLECVFDKTHLTDTKGALSNLGIFFYQSFRKSIENFFISNAKDHLPIIINYNKEEALWVSNTLISVLENIVKDKNMRKRFARKVTETLLSTWAKLGTWWDISSTQELKRSTVTLMRNILLIDPKCLSEVKSSHELVETYIILLQDKSTTLTLKTQCLELLPCFTMTTMEEPQLNKIRCALGCLVADNFPLSSREFINGTPKYSDYIAALDKILSSLVISSSLMLLDLLIVIICREESHSHEEKIQEQLTKFMKRLNLQKARKALDICFRIFKNESEHRNQTRRSVIDKVCLVLLRATSCSVLREFFVDHIKEIMEIIEGRFSKSTESLFETQLISKLCCFELLDVLYTRLPKSDLNSPEARINKAYCNIVKTGKELTMSITKSAHSAKSEDMRGETQLLSLRRQYHCTAYNTLMSVISCTQTELKFYAGFLFTENLTKGQFLLDNIVDCTKKLQFEMELSTPIDKRTQLTTIRRLARARTYSDEDESGEFAHSLHYLASQYLADSSLSEEVSQFDFSTPVQALTQPESGNTAETSVGPPSPKESDFDIASEVMEMDDLNRNECMSSLISLLNHLTKNKISPTPHKGETPKEMPSWMSYLHKKLSNHTSHINVRLFITKLVTNLPEIFQPFAKFWFNPLMELLLSPDFMSEEMNYFVTDILVTMLSWSSVAIPEDSFSGRHLTNRLLEYFMKNCNHKTRSIFRNNLEIIKTFVEVWKDRVEVPCKVIYEQFSHTDPNKKDNSVGIQLLGIILTNNMSPNLSGSGVDTERFYKSLVANISFKYKEVHAAAAEVIGMSLKTLTENDKVTRDMLESYVHEKLLTMSNDVDKQITCLHKLQLHYPPIIDRFINQILFVIPNVHGVFKTLCFEIILSRVSSINNLFLELSAKGFIATLNYRNEECQIACLKIVLGLLNVLTVPQINSVMPSVTAFSSHKNTTCREIMFDILIWIYDTYRFDDTFKTEEGSDEVLGTAKDFLLQGLADENKDIRLKLRNFWSDETRLPCSTIERLVQVLKAMYSSNTESQYLSYTTNLILQLTSQSPDFSRFIFEQPLSECKFQEYTIDCSWQQRNSSMTPLFAATQSTQIPSSQQSFGSLSLDAADGPLRATQQPQFTPTQASTSAPSQSYDWLQPTNVESGSFSQSITARSSTQSSLLFKSTAHSRRFPLVGSNFGLPARKTSGETRDTSPNNSQSENIMKLKRRFLKDRSGEHVYFAKREIRREKLRQESLEQQKKARGNKIVMYRKYRDGDLPDIQIKHSDLIAPLQALAQCDSNIAKQLFSSIFQGIFSQLEENLTETQAEETFTGIQDALNNMLSFSLQFVPPFISCVQSICYNEKKLSLEPGKVTSTSISSLQQPIGIMLLEKQIMKISEECVERPSKRQKSSNGSPSTETTTTWIELAKLYKSVEDFDVLRGIFCNQIGTQSITKEALEAEGRGDYTTALRLYSQASGCDDWPNGDPLEEEKDLWDDSKLECCRRLTLWDKMEEYILVNIDENDGVPNLDQLWEDEYYQEHYLPFLFRSKTKRFSSGGIDETFLDFIGKSLKNEQKKMYLETKFSDLLALFFILQEDYDRARYYTGNCLQTFLSDWSGLDSMMSSSRSSQLNSLQTLTEMQEFLDFIGCEENFTSTSAVVSLLKRWSLREPDTKLHSVDIWDDIITNRWVYMDKILGKYKTSTAFTTSADSMEVDDCSINLEQLEKKFVRQRVMFSLRLSEAATEQVNFPVAKKQLQNSLHFIKDTLNNERDLEVLWTHAYSDLNCKKCHVLEPSEAITTAMLAIEQLDKLKDSKVLIEDLSSAVRHHLLKSNALDAITKSLNGTSVWESLSESCRAKLVGLSGAKASDGPQKVITEFTKKSFTTLQNAVKTAQTNDNKQQTSESRIKMVESLMTMANFCDRILREKEEAREENLAPKLDTKMFPGIIIRYVLKSMAYESTEARQKFPRLLQLVELYPGGDLEAFIRKAADVPCWMFIGWINQMVALLDKKESKAVHMILQEISNNYPQALIYPFKISSEQFKFGGSTEEQHNKTFVEKLKGQIYQHLPMLDKFILALEQLTDSHMVFKDWIDETQPLLENKKGNETLIRESFKQMTKKLFDVKQRGITPDGVEMGSIRRNFAKEFSKNVFEKFGNDGSKILQMSHAKQFSNTASGLWEEMKSSKVKNRGNLKDYSPWLSNFQRHGNIMKLEIPGQYTGKSKPLSEYHVKIAGFDEKVLALRSIRAPKRLTIRGNDEREYNFLVKGGEDLRLDQRIEQLFCLMNDIMKEDPACHQRKLKLRTYKVIPMTSRIAVIEWLENTKVFKEFFTDGLTETEKNTYSSDSNGPIVMYQHWLWGFKTGKDNKFMCYDNMCRKASRQSVERKFREIQNIIPENALRRSFLQLSSSAEAFLILRSHFARTHACLCICQYILGIGDRHLNNSMVDLVTGGVIGIDFGHAFGSATQFLRLPELIPFRLTRQIVNLMLPLKESGLLQSAMIYTMRALRKNNEILLNTMDIFIKEPSLDWQICARKQAKQQETEIDGDQTWYPREKIQSAKRKLQGENPAEIMRYDLEHGNAKSRSCYSAKLSILLGDPKYNQRARPYNNSVENQVACLIDQATDPNILGRTWEGWEPWV